MNTFIKILPKFIYSKIAAGEIIHNLSSIVKEIIENSIDANAKTIKLIVQDYGKSFIQIIDDGYGMQLNDVLICCKRYSTSKISHFKDLTQLSTMGFRGEALFSIASIARITIITRYYKEEIGTSLIIQNNNILECKKCYCNIGTSIIVDNIFFNFPARRKSIKSNFTELQNIINVFIQNTLSNLDIEFYMYHQNKKIFHTCKSSLIDRLISIYKIDYINKIIPIYIKNDNIVIDGFISNPNYIKNCKKYQFIFINKRYTTNNNIHNAIIDIYKKLLLKHSNPFYIINININPTFLDININPDKSKIELYNLKSINNLIKNSIKIAIEKYNFNDNFIIPSISKTSYKNITLYSKNNNYFKDKNKLDAIKYLKEILINNNNMKLKTYQLFNKYIVINIFHGIMLIDQKIAHQKILYEQCINNKNNNSNILLFPNNIILNDLEYKLFMELSHEFSLLGFIYDIKYNNNIIIKGVPNIIYFNDQINYLKLLLDNYKNNLNEYRKNKKDSIAKYIAKICSIKYDVELNCLKRYNIVYFLFLCKKPTIGLEMKSTIELLTFENIEKKFKKYDLYI